MHCDVIMKLRTCLCATGTVVALRMILHLCQPLPTRSPRMTRVISVICGWVVAPCLITTRKLTHECVQT